ncbi:MAG: DUF421 domain-containing protein [Clostridia bacterium]|nr:DUF421 domain-containing protein [Clostridia bacterium]
MLIVLIRTLIVFFVLLAAMRLMGKRQLGELEINELVIAILISNFAAHPLQDIAIPLMNGLLPIIILLCCELIISGLVLKSPRVRVVICGKPSILVAKGKIDQREMQKNRFTLDELAEELRNQSVVDISTIQYAVLETDGRLNVILYPSERPVSPAQLGLEIPNATYPIIVINNGELMKKNLPLTGRDENWLQDELKLRNVKRISDVYYMTVDSLGNIYFARKETSR